MGREVNPKEHGIRGARVFVGRMTPSHPYIDGAIPTGPLPPDLAAAQRRDFARIRRLKRWLNTAHTDDSKGASDAEV